VVLETKVDMGTNTARLNQTNIAILFIYDCYWRWLDDS